MTMWGSFRIQYWKKKSGILLATPLSQTECHTTQDQRQAMRDMMWSDRCGPEARVTTVRVTASNTVGERESALRLVTTAVLPAY
jgi:hypothetical protein